MTAKKRGLGRGLDALLGGGRVDNASERTTDSDDRTEGEYQLIPIDLVGRGRYQPRTDFDPEALAELAGSISAQGLVQPVVVRPIDDGRFELIAGERRWRAAQMAGLQEIPAIVRDVPDQAAVAMALIENIQREDLNPLEEANALQRLLQEFHLTHQQVAEAVGKSRTTVTNMLRLLELNSDVKTMMARGDLEMGHARALLALKGDIQTAAAVKVGARGLSVRETERLVRRLLNPPAPAANVADPDPDVRHLQQSLAEKLGAEVSIQQGSKGRGKLVITYNSLDELDGILAHFK